MNKYYSWMLFIKTPVQMYSKIFKLNIGIILLCIGISSCNINERKSEVFPTIYIKPNLKEISCMASEILSDIKVVNLETNSMSFIGNFSSLIFVNHKNIIYRSDKCFLIFNNQGKYLNKIDAIGKGYGEYTTIVNVFVDPTKEYIYIGL